ncbi:MAG TPA: DsbA family oxidoreductase [Caulobacteraceae bacterium]|jgi:predicted DsbA family dithiol-disulfide isomerase|nr:DsbA family oxidoreductase [Caulobacteraceae bacterium]
MTKTLKIDFVSDVSCPWCVVGLGSLEQALQRLGDEVKADLHFQPFELNPDMGPEGQNKVDNLIRKYGSSREQIAANREALRRRAAEVGFTMAQTDDSRVYNTFDAHRLLHWAGIEGAQAALKRALFETYFTHNRDLGDPEVLAAAAERAGLDRDAAHEVLRSGRYAAEVRAAERQWQEAGISSVPAVVINDRYLISGGQPPETFESALRRIAAEP